MTRVVLLCMLEAVKCVSWSNLEVVFHVSEALEGCAVLLYAPEALEQRIMEEWRYGGIEIWRVGCVEGCRYGGRHGVAYVFMPTCEHGGMEVWRHGGMEEWRPIGV